jgi:Asp-tRNA(Asn)/Glu-tRNA(Gln) amidotransferase A subunit family amidase
MKMRNVGLGLGLGMLAIAATTPAALAADPEDSIVKLTSVRRLPNPVRPWANQYPMAVGGTGVVIDGKRTLTVAHRVTYAEDVSVQAGQGGDRLEDKFAALALRIDLAVMTIDPAEGDFFDKRSPLPRAAELPSVSAREEVKGFPLGDYLAAQASLTTFLEQSATDFWKDCDVLATPTLAVPPFSTKLPLGPARVVGVEIDPQADWAFTWTFNLTGQPAVSIPCGWTKDGLPLGLQLVGRRGADCLVLRVAAAIEALAPWSDRRPKEE